MVAINGNSPGLIGSGLQVLKEQLNPTNVFNNVNALLDSKKGSETAAGDFSGALDTAKNRHHFTTFGQIVSQWQSPKNMFQNLLSRTSVIPNLRSSLFNTAKNSG